MAARYFDGIRSHPHPVSIRIDAGRLLVSGQAVDRNETLDSIVISERIGRTPRFVRFSDGAFCEVSDLDALHSLLSDHGLDRSRLARWEGSTRMAIAAVLLVALTAFVGYRYGLPAAAKVSADRMPVSALDRLSRQVLTTLDRTLLEPSRLPPTEQTRIRSAFAALRLTGARPMRLEFRRSRQIGANAFALPSGIIVVTDDLVSLATDPDQVTGVLAHEAGHVVGRHGLRKMIQSSVSSMFVTWYIGDVSALGAAAPTALLQAHYSRDLEREADAYAARVLRENGIRPSVLADMLERLSSQRASSVESAFSYLSSHPATEERLQTLHAFDARSSQE